MSLIDDLLAFVNDGKVADGIVQAYETMGQEELRVVAIKLLSWLKSQQLVRSQQPLRLNMQHDWANQLVKWHANDPRLAALFQISGEFADFHPDIDTQTRSDILLFVDSQYSPPLSD